MVHVVILRRKMDDLLMEVLGMQMRNMQDEITQKETVHLSNNSNGAPTIQ